MENKLDRDKQKLLGFIEKSLKSLQKQVLDLTEIAVPPQNWKALRSKILGITNDFRRDIEDELAQNYNVKFTPSTVYEDLVIVQNKARKGNDDNGNTTNG
jgi:hypothetical protein